MSIQLLIDKMPRNVVTYLDSIRTQSKNGIISEKERNDRVSAYCHGLMDAGLLSDRERGQLYIYYTL